jgi:hypothetical protein
MDGWLVGRTQLKHLTRTHINATVAREALANNKQNN